MKKLLLVLLAVCCTAGFAQTVKPSITIGTHVLTLGMSEMTVLEQVGSDLTLRKWPPSKFEGAKETPASTWAAQRDTKSGVVIVGTMDFDGNHVLIGATRRWEIEESSSRSLFDALNDAMSSVEKDGLTTCVVATNGRSRTLGSLTTGGHSGTLNTREILMNCGVKQIRLTLNLSDVSGMVPIQIDVFEWLRRE
jgi:hypothetical protein